MADYLDRLKKYIEDSVAQELDTISNDRASNLQVYNSEPYGNEREGRSKIVTSEVRDAIMWLLAPTLKSILSSNQIVEFKAASEGEESMAELQTDYINYIVLEDNNSFPLFYQWLLDCFIMKNGYVKYFADVEANVSKESYKQINEFELGSLMERENDDFKIVEAIEDYVVSVDEIGAEVQTAVYDVECDVTSRKVKYFIENIRPDMIIYDINATSIENAKFIGIIYYKDRDDLLALGYGKDKIDNLPQEVEEDYNNDIPYAADEKYKIIESYIKVYNESKKAFEIKKVVSNETVSVVLEEDIVDEIPIANISPFIRSHSFTGDSIVDITKNIQLVNTTLWRQMLDYIYLTNEPMYEADTTQIVNTNDLLRRVPGGIIRSRKPGSVLPLQNPQLQPETFGLLDRISNMKDIKTGIMPLNQGIDPTTINKNVGGTLEIMDAGRQIPEMIIRTIAETGFKRLFKGIYRLVTKHQPEEIRVKLGNKWKTIDPSLWGKDPDINVSIGLGAGSNRIKTEYLENILKKQVELMPMGLSNPEHIFNTLSKVVSVAGYKDADEFFQDPKQLPPQQPEAPKPSIEEIAVREIEAGLEKEKIKAEVKKYDTDIKAEIDNKEIDADVQLKLLEMGRQGITGASFDV